MWIGVHLEESDGGPVRRCRLGADRGSLSISLVATRIFAMPSYRRITNSLRHLLNPTCAAKMSCAVDEATSLAELTSISSDPVPRTTALAASQRALVAAATCCAAETRPLDHRYSSLSSRIETSLSMMPRSMSWKRSKKTQYEHNGRDPSGTALFVHFFSE